MGSGSGGKYWPEQFYPADEWPPRWLFYGLLDTNAVPLWEEANPGTPGSPILQVTIKSPANGSVLQ